MPRIRALDGRSLHVRVIGRGPQIVLLHGFGMESRHWLPVVLPLAHRFQFILPDFRGFGGSSRHACTEDCILTSHAQDVHAVLEQLTGNQPVGLGGISLGASTALRYMELYGTAQVRRYLHIDQSPRIGHDDGWPWGIFGEEGPAQLERWRPFLDRLGRFPAETPFEALPADLREQFYDDLGYFLAKALSKPWMKWGARRAASVPLLANELVPVDNWYTLYQHMRAYAERDYDFLPLLPQLELPVRVMVGRHSEMYPWAGQLRMLDLLPNAELVVMENSGHVPLLDQPLRFIRELSATFA
ncbi:MAG: alpha/beta hydrolase [Marinobacter sp.]|nr:alpha/beta hydrolase [Marinobacter sp.]